MLMDKKLSEKNGSDALDFYASILQRTMDVLGEERLTEPVIVKLLETASYITWRNIMGGKFDKKDDKSDDEDEWVTTNSTYGTRKRR